MTPLDYHCKVCHKPGVAYYHPDCPIHHLESWQGALTCKRCYTFRDGYSSCKRAIEQACVGLINMRQTVHDSEVLSMAEEKVRERLNALTRKMATLCSDYYRVTDIWDVEMVNVLMDNPTGCNKSINAFRVGYSKHSEHKTYAF